MKIRAIDEQAYYNVNGMSITTGQVYEVIDNPFAMKSNCVVVLGEDGRKVIMTPDEFEIVEE